ncbi:MAG: tetratricopeptide repeat protein [Acidobacteria bacterium]|nr:tetratricopeptide repeat protein [Acidobacteriota bacterium]
MPRLTPLACGKLLLSLCLLLCLQTLAHAQGMDNYEAERKRAIELYEQNKYIEALPIFEKLAAANSQDREVQELYGHLLAATAITEKDAAKRKQMRARARTYLLRAQELGADNALLKQTLAGIPPDGGDAGSLTFSNKAEAEDAMREGEAAFMAGDMSKARKSYERAMKADPQLYEAPLFMGDVYYKTEKYDEAGEWFARAIAVDPNRETAYRYWGDVLMRQGKMDAARDKFVEAYITEPYNRLAPQGLIQWAQRNKVRLAHPKIEIPVNVSGDKDNARITLDSAMLNGKDNGLAAWLLYGGERARWKTEKFARTYPGEKAYRHSLAEEAAALRAVLSFVESQLKEKKIKELEPSLAELKKLNDAGLLEAYILLARADAGIVEDHAAYLKTNRDQLRRYALEFVIQK